MLWEQNIIFIIGDVSHAMMVTWLKKSCVSHRDLAQGLESELIVTLTERNTLCPFVPEFLLTNVETGLMVEIFIDVGLQIKIEVEN